MIKSAVPYKQTDYNLTASTPHTRFRLSGKIRMSETITHTFTVPEQEDGSRLDRFLAERLRDEGISREKAKELIKGGKVRVDDLCRTQPKFILSGGSRVDVGREQTSGKLAAEQGELTVIYRDPVLAVINKPAGITVHPAPGLPGGTLANRLVAHFPELAAVEGFRPGIVHRLDKDTSGLMLVALTEQCRLLLSAQFAGREVFKEYLTLIRGVPPKKQGFIEAPIGRHPSHKTRMAVIPNGKPASSAWRVLYSDPGGRFSLLAVRIFTGRTHQVRVHMQHIGHTLLGDSVYTSPADNDSPIPQASRQMLHAWRLAFNHPLPENIPKALTPVPDTDAEGRLAFLVPPPQDFSDCMLAASRLMVRVVVTGSPGSGKSALSAALHNLGLPLFSADAVVADLYRPGGDGQHLLRAWFGERFVPDEKMPVDKVALGKAMREDQALRRQVESLLHPLVWHALQEFWQRTEDQGHRAAVAEIPLYLESGRKELASDLSGSAPLLIGVHCPFSMRRQRLKDIRGWSDETISEVESWQWPEEKKMQACDIVTDNTGDLHSLERAAGDLLGKFEKIYADRENGLARSFAALWSKA